MQLSKEACVMLLGFFPHKRATLTYENRFARSSSLARKGLDELLKLELIEREFNDPEEIFRLTDKGLAVDRRALLPEGMNVLDFLDQEGRFSISEDKKDAKP